jgi:sigma54-dependent transcription regulator
MDGGGVGMAPGRFEQARRAFASGDILGARQMLTSIGVTGNEQEHVLKLFENIAAYITGRGAEANMPGSSPDKPMYTQVVNVRDFREALFHRLNVVPIVLPPVRERKEDVLPLVEYFLKKYNQENKKNVLSLSKEPAVKHI